MSFYISPLRPDVMRMCIFMPYLVSVKDPVPRFDHRNCRLQQIMGIIFIKQMIDPRSVDVHYSVIYRINRCNILISDQPDPCIISCLHFLLPPVCFLKMPQVCSKSGLRHLPVISKYQQLFPVLLSVLPLRTAVRSLHGSVVH